MNVEIQWQDADSSSYKGVEELFPNVNVMCVAGMLDEPIRRGWRLSQRLRT